MAKPRYRRRHQNERARLAVIVARGEAYCAQSECVMPNRWIPPDSRWCLGHDDTGTRWIGPVHERCNARDGAVRGNRMRAGQDRRWVL